MKVYALVMLPIGLVLSVVLCTWVLAWGRRRGWIDQGGREVHKQHDTATVNLGGVAITAALVLPMLLILLAVSLLSTSWIADWSPALAEHWPGLSSQLWMGWSLLLGMLVMHGTGLADDRLGLGPWLKLGIQIAVAVFLVLCCQLHLLTYLATAYGVVGNVASVILSVLWLVALMNAMNFMDNMDALAGGVAAIIVSAMFGVALSNEQWFVAAVAGLLLGSIVGFLFFNFSPARLFMGDNGSLVLGLLVGFISVRLNYTEIGSVDDMNLMAYLPLLAPVLWLSIPLYDLISVCIIRISHGTNPMQGDHNHLSHRLLRMNLGGPGAVGTIHLLTVMTCIGGVLVASLTPTTSWLGAVMTGATLLALMTLDISYSTVTGFDGREDEDEDDEDDDDDEEDE